MGTGNARRGFFRATLVASIAAGGVIMFGSSRPSLDDFRMRPATETEKARAAEWAKTQENSPEVLDDLKNDRPAAPHHVSMYVTAHYGLVAKEHQGLVPLEYALRYYVLSFSLGFLATWAFYAVIRFVIFGYVARGFR
jgi:hypothetical protein